MKQNKMVVLIEPQKDLKEFSEEEKKVGNSLKTFPLEDVSGFLVKTATLTYENIRREYQMYKIKWDLREFEKEKGTIKVNELGEFEIRGFEKELTNKIYNKIIELAKSDKFYKRIIGMHNEES
jgi:hypothetical protein